MNKNETSNEQMKYKNDHLNNNNIYGINNFLKKDYAF